LGAHLIFVDEAGFLLIPSVRKTWGPVGQTPIVGHRYAHDRISAISGIAVSPKRFRCTLYCQLYEDNLQGEEVATFLRHLLRQIPGHLVVLLDNGGIHRGNPVQELLARTSRLHLEPFPPYAPELNPDEGVWNHLKAHLATGRPDTSAALMDVLTEEVCGLAASPALLRGCIEQSELPPFLP
jgi:transposase